MTTAPTGFVGQALPAKIVKVASTNLFRVAEQALGDATQWYRIAALNPAACTNAETGLIDPWIVGPVDLLIPGPGTSNGGIPTG